LMGIASLHPSCGTEGGGRGAPVSKGDATSRNHLRGHETRTPGPRNHPACLDFRQSDSPLVT